MPGQKPCIMYGYITRCIYWSYIWCCRSNGLGSAGAIGSAWAEGSHFIVSKRRGATDYAARTPDWRTDYPACLARLEM